jgi:hypothetical protein
MGSLLKYYNKNNKKNFPNIATKKLEDSILVEINGGGALYITVYDYRRVSQKCRKDICRIETQKLTANRMLKK